MSSPSCARNRFVRHRSSSPEHVVFWLSLCNDQESPGTTDTCAAPSGLSCPSDVFERLGLSGGVCVCACPEFPALIAIQGLSEKRPSEVMVGCGGRQRRSPCFRCGMHASIWPPKAMFQNRTEPRLHATHSAEALRCWRHTLGLQHDFLSQTHEGKIFWSVVNVDSSSIRTKAS